MEACIIEHNEKYEGTDPLIDINTRYLKKLNKKKLQKKGVKKLEGGNDPFNEFGHGIQQYFKTQKRMMAIFVVLIIIMLPVMYLYTEGHRFAHTVYDKELKISLGNLG